MSDIIVGSVGVRLVPNAEGFAAKAKALTRGLTADVRMDLDDKDARARIAELGRPREAKINADADTAKASAQLDAAAHDRRVHFEATGLSAMVTGVAALGPALVPIVAAAAGLTAALGAPLAAVGGGATLYALIAGKAVKDTEAQSKAIDQLQKKVEAAKQSVANASTAAGKKSALATLATDTKAYNDALNKLNPAQAAFLKAQGGLKSAFADLERSAGPAIFGPLTTGMQALATVLPKVGPVLKPVSAAISGLLDEVARSAKSGAVNDFLNFLAAMSGPAITQAGHILGNVALGFAGIASAFAPIGSKIGDALQRWSDGFSRIGSSQGLTSFVAYVGKEGPRVAQTLGAVAGALVHIGQALAPIGGVSLAALDGLARGISAIPVHVLTVLAGGFIAVTTALKGMQIAAAVVGGVRALAGAFALLSGAIDANPISLIALGLVALGAGLVVAYKKSETFRNIVTGALHAVGEAGRWLWNNALQPALHFIVDAMGHVMVAAGKMLQALGHVPGFGWAKTAGNLMVAAGHAAEGLADNIRKIPNSKSISVKLNGASGASAILAGLQARLNSLHSKTITVAINTASHAAALAGVHGAPGSALGSTVPKDGGPYADRFPYLLAPGEEVISNKHGQADRHRALLKAINAGHLAGGGTAGWGMPSWPGGWKMPHQSAPPKGNWMQQILTGFFKNLGGPSLGEEIRKLKDELKDGTRQINELSKARKGESKSEKAAREREVKALQAHEKVLQKNVDALKAQQSAVKAFTLSSVLPQATPHNPILAGTRAEVKTFEHDFTKAGGKWTGALQDHAHRMLHDALALDKATRAQDAATTAAQNQKQALDSLTSTMQQFGDSVSGQFATGLFGLTDANGAPMAATANSVINSLNADSTNLTAFIKAAGALAGEGLDKSVLSELYSKGDLASAQSLASMSPGGIASINTAAQTRSSLMGQLSTQAATDVYGTQYAAALAASAKADQDVKAATTRTAELINALTQEVRELKAIANRPIVLDGEVVHHSVTKRNQTVTRTTGKNPLASSGR